MAKAQITTPEGMRIELEGTSSELTTVLSYLMKQARANGGSMQGGKKDLLDPDLLDDLNRSA